MLRKHKGDVRSLWSGVLCLIDMKIKSRPFIFGDYVINNNQIHNHSGWGY